MTRDPLYAARVLAIDPTTRGFGYAVLEGPTSLIDWGLTEVSAPKHANCIRRIETLIRRYAPDVLVLEDYGGAGSRRCARVKRLIRSAAFIARRSGVKTRRFSRRRIRQVLGGGSSTTKEALADAVAARFPELLPHRPRFRKPWMSEDERMSIFDAASLALTYYERTKSRLSSLSEGLPRGGPLAAA